MKDSYVRDQKKVKGEMGDTIAVLCMLLLTTNAMYSSYRNMHYGIQITEINETVCMYWQNGVQMHNKVL